MHDLVQHLHVALLPVEQEHTDAVLPSSAAGRNQPPLLAGANLDLTQFPQLHQKLCFPLPKDPWEQDLLLALEDGLLVLLRLLVVAFRINRQGLLWRVPLLRGGSVGAGVRGDCGRVFGLAGGLAFPEAATSLTSFGGASELHDATRALGLEAP